MYANFSLQRITGTVVPVRITNVIVQIPIPKAIIIAIVQVATDAYKSLIIQTVSRLIRYSRGRAPYNPPTKTCEKDGHRRTSKNNQRQCSKANTKGHQDRHGSRCHRYKPSLLLQKCRSNHNSKYLTSRQLQ